MNRRFVLKRAFCICMALLLLLIFCAVGHSCHHDHCPVCILTATFRLGLGLVALAFGMVFLPRFACRLTDAYVPKAGGICSLVALKVKLSD